MEYDDFDRDRPLDNGDADPTAEAPQDDNDLTYNAVTPDSDEGGNDIDDNTLGESQVTRVRRWLGGLLSSRVSPGVGEDGPYERKDLVRDPRSGEMVPAMELLDDVHLQVRADELIRQAKEPRPEAVTIPEADVPQSAFDLLMSLRDAVSSEVWEVREQTLDEGTILRTHTASEESADVPGRQRFFTAQLEYDDAQSTSPRYGNLDIYEPTAGGWPREYYFQASPIRRSGGSAPHVRYDDYPYHEETLGRPEHNTVFGLEQAQRMIARIMRR